MKKLLMTSIFLMLGATAMSAITEDKWWGFRREKFDFEGYTAWVVYPSTEPAAGRPWTWTMQWADAYVDRTGVLDLLRQGWHHVTIEIFDTRMNAEGLKVAADFQKFLVEKKHLAKKANLVGMSWGGFFSVRYAANYPENVRKIYLDAPLMNFDNFNAFRVLPWKLAAGATNWSDNPEMPINLAGKLAAAKIPVLLLYGGQDQTVIPKFNCEIFVERFKAAGGEIKVDCRQLFGHHPHGTDPDKTAEITEFFKKD